MGQLLGGRSVWIGWRVLEPILLLALGALVLGVIFLFVYRAMAPPFFQGEVLTRDTVTLEPEDLGTPDGSFGIEPNEDPVPPEPKRPS